MRTTRTPYNLAAHLALLPKGYLLDREGGNDVYYLAEESGEALIEVAEIFSISPDGVATLHYSDYNWRVPMRLG